PLVRLQENAEVYGLFTGPGSQFFRLTPVEQARLRAASPYPGHSITLSSRLLLYTGESMAWAPIALAMFVLSLFARRRVPSPARAALTGLAACGGYLSIMVIAVKTHLFFPLFVGTHERLMVWLPNLILALLTIVVVACAVWQKARRSELEA